MNDPRKSPEAGNVAANLDEFERRLRGSAIAGITNPMADGGVARQASQQNFSQQNYRHPPLQNPEQRLANNGPSHNFDQASEAKSDPLAELARLVGGDDPFRVMFAPERRQEPNQEVRAEARLEARPEARPERPDNHGGFVQNLPRPPLNLAPNIAPGLQPELPPARPVNNSAPRNFAPNRDAPRDTSSYFDPAQPPPSFFNTRQNTQERFTENSTGQSPPALAPQMRQPEPRQPEPRLPQNFAQRSSAPEPQAYSDNYGMDPALSGLPNRQAPRLQAPHRDPFVPQIHNPPIHNASYAGQNFDPNFSKNFAFQHDPAFVDHDDPYQDGSYSATTGQDGGYHDDFDALAGEADHPSSLPASRSRFIVIAALVAILGGGGAGAYYVYKNFSTTPANVSIIKAQNTPAKIPAPADSGNQDNASPITPASGETKVVSRTEQPVDLKSQLAKQGSAGANSSAPAPVSTSGSESVANFPTPKRVKTYTVRPDGSIVGGADQSGAAKPTTPPQAPSAITRQAASSAVPTPPIAPDSDAQDKAKQRSGSNTVPSLARQPAAAATPTGEPLQLLAQNGASGNTANSAATRTPAANITSAAANGASNTTPAIAAGGFAAQLAAPTTEQEAKDMIARLEQKYADALGSNRLSVHKVVASGRTIYRVRVSGLTKEAADDVCGKVLAGGGACFVASN